MRLDHMSDRERKTRAENLYEKRGFTISGDPHPLLAAASLAIAIQKELVAASVFPDYRNIGREIVETNWGDVLRWIAEAEKDEDDRAVFDSIILTREQRDLLEDFADILPPLAKGITKTSVSKFKKRYQTRQEKAAEAAEKKLAKDTGEDTSDTESVSKGVTVAVCDSCDDFAYVPNGFAAKKCTLTRGCEGTLMRPPKCERHWTTKKKEAARKREEKKRLANGDAEDE